MNAPDRMDTVRVPADQAKIQMTVDQKVANAAYFKVLREDHTVGNLLRMDLLRDPTIKFAGYKHPHPLENDIIVRIQAGRGTPASALRDSLRRLEDEYRQMHKQFAEEVRRVKRQEAALE